MAEILSYGAYLPKYRAPLGEIQAFFGRPGRPRAKALATPALDEDTLTMAYEAGTRAVGDGPAPTAVVNVCLSPPFGLRKMGVTLARALDLEEAATFDVGGHPGALLDGFRLAGALADAGETVLVVVSDHQVSYEDKVCDMLSAGGAAAFVIGASGGIARLGAQARTNQEIYDVWVLGTEGEPRYRMEVLFNAYADASKAAIAGLAKASGKDTGTYAHVAASQPHPQCLKALGKAGVGAEQIAATSVVGEIGNLGAASLGIALAMALDAAQPGESVLAFGYGAGEGIAQALEVTASAPSGIADHVAGEPINVSTYYRWTRGRHVEPH